MNKINEAQLDNLRVSMPGVPAFGESPEMTEINEFAELNDSGVNVHAANCENNDLNKPLDTIKESHSNVFFVVFFFFIFFYFVLFFFCFSFAFEFS